MSLRPPMKKLGIAILRRDVLGELVVGVEVAVPAERTEEAAGAERSTYVSMSAAVSHAGSRRGPDPPCDGVEEAGALAGRNSVGTPLYISPDAAHNVCASSRRIRRRARRSAGPTSWK